MLAPAWGKVGRNVCESTIWDKTFHLTVQVSLQATTRAVTPGWAVWLPAKISDPATSSAAGWGHT